MNTITVGLSADKIYWHSRWYFETPARSASRPSDRCEIDVGRSRTGAYVSYWPSNEAARLGNNIVLPVRDRESFRRAWRYARLWRINGIARHVFCPPKGGVA
jgi:hypothetical protein|tara:strand:+ start:5274 stop:5579 length:306 start_codon:yes stop_codon:yes gene_type:complete